MVYKVIGLMSGSSVDGLDIAFVSLEEKGGQWSYEFLNALCIPYSEQWQNKLRNAHIIEVAEFLKLNTSYGRYTGECVNEFIEKNNLEHQVALVASHGHTVFHEPENNTTFQIGEGATIAAVTGLPVISDLRAIDVALGGQGAPIVPIGDKLLFGQYEYLLNIGGIANITIQQPGRLLAFDVCPANRILNALAGYNGLDMDKDGELASHGICLKDILSSLNDSKFYRQNEPKSLNNEIAEEMIFPKLMQSEHELNDLLHTMCVHIAEQVADVIKKFPPTKTESKLLVTGGGALNKFLIKLITRELAPLSVAVVIPDERTVKFKEALIMALIGVLRWRGENNVLSSVTGAKRDSIGGASWQ